MAISSSPVITNTPSPRARVANALFAAAAIGVGIAAPTSSLLFIGSLGLAVAASIIHPEPIRLRLQALATRKLLPVLMPFALLLLLGIYHTITRSDRFTLTGTAATALILPLLLASSVARAPRNFVYLAQGLFLGSLLAISFKSPSATTAAPYLLLACALLLEIIVFIPALSWRLTAALAAQAAILFVCFAALDCWPLLLLLPFALAPTLAKIIARIPYSIGRLSVWVSIAFLWLFSLSYFAHIVDTYFTGHQQDKTNLPALTRNGNPYIHDPLSHDKENGYYVDIYICPDELEAQWPALGSLPLDAPTPNGRTVYETLIRYLTSLDLHKDSVGLAELSPRDIRAIERGIYNANLVGKSLIFTSAWHELEAFDRYLQTRQPSTRLTTIAEQSAQAREALASAPALGSGPRFTAATTPHSIGLFSLPLALGPVPTLLLFALLAVPAGIAIVDAKRSVRPNSLSHLGLTAFAVAVVASLSAAPLLTPAFAGLCALLLTLALTFPPERSSTGF